MKILFFGNSHVGAFKQGLSILAHKQQKSDLEKQIHNFYTKKKHFNFTTIIRHEASNFAFYPKTFQHKTKLGSFKNCRVFFV